MPIDVIGLVIDAMRNSASFGIGCFVSSFRCPTASRLASPFFDPTTTAARLTSRFHGTTSIKWRLHDYSNGIVKDQNIDESRNTEACDCHVIVRDNTRAAVF